MSKKLKETKRKIIKRLYDNNNNERVITVQEEEQNNIIGFLLKYKDIAPILTIIFTAIVSISRIYLSKGIKNYYGIPEIIEISSKSFIASLINDLIIAIILSTIVFAFIELHKVVNEVSKKEKKMKRFIISFEIVFLIRAK